MFSKYKKGDRVIIYAGKNDKGTQECWLATITGIRNRKVYLKFDDGSRGSTDDEKDILAFGVDTRYDKAFPKLKVQELRRPPKVGVGSKKQVPVSSPQVAREDDGKLQDDPKFKKLTRKDLKPPKKILVKNKKRHSWFILKGVGRTQLMIEVDGEKMWVHKNEVIDMKAATKDDITRSQVKVKKKLDDCVVKKRRGKRNICF